MNFDSSGALPLSVDAFVEVRQIDLLLAQPAGVSAVAINTGRNIVAVQSVRTVRNSYRPTVITTPFANDTSNAVVFTTAGKLQTYHRRKSTQVYQLHLSRSSSTLNLSPMLVILVGVTCGSTLRNTCAL